MDAIEKVEIRETLEGYACRAEVKVNGHSAPHHFRLFVPVSTYGAIEQSVGRFDWRMIEKLFIARIRQNVGRDKLEGVPPGWLVDFGTLLWGEVDTLLLDLDTLHY